MQKLKVVSLFDGISCGRVALEKLNIPVEKYVAFEIDENAIKVSKSNFPDIEHRGDVNSIDFKEFENFDLILGGSPCQGFSYSGKMLNFNDPRSSLFFKYAELVSHVTKTNPNVKFLLENVCMKKEWQDVISTYLQVNPVFINSEIVSAQGRKRLYWTNIDFYIGQASHKNICIKDILEDIENRKTIDMDTFRNVSFGKGYVQYDVKGKGHKSQDQRAFYFEGKTGSLNTQCAYHAKFLLDNIVYYFTQTELERLQTLPDGYTKILSKAKAGHAIGNGWSVDTVALILKGLGGH